VAIKCPHCSKSIGGAATEGGLRLRLGIVLIDPDDGAVHGPCPHCKADVRVAKSAVLVRHLEDDNNDCRLIPALLVRRS